ncbi:MAG TPA: hypothetical protein V6D17_03075 [Candidatus Obscuribacterales bacterium]
MKSRLFCALLLFVLMDFALRLSFRPALAEKLENSNHSAVWWALRDYQNNGNADIVMLGSSLMQQVVDDGEATYLKRDIDPSQYHRCQHLEDLLTALVGAPVKTFSFALAGEFASDAAMLAKIMPAFGHPSRIIYGIAPRDFMDNSLSCPASTEVFRLVSRLDPERGLALERRAYASQWDYWTKLFQARLENISSLYGRRLEIAYAWKNRCDALALSVLQFFPDRSADLLTPRDRASIPEDIRPGQKVIHPEWGTPVFFDNRAQYICSYQPFRPRSYGTQLSYFKDLLQCCAENSIAVTVVNMPITKDNMELMQAGFYKLYLDDVSRAALNASAEFVDLNQSGLFEKADFKDTVHLNGYGAQKFVKLLAARLSNSTVNQLASAVRARQVAESRQFH